VLCLNTTEFLKVANSYIFRLDEVAILRVYMNKITRKIIAAITGLTSRTYSGYTIL